MKKIFYGLTLTIACLVFSCKNNPESFNKNESSYLQIIDSTEMTNNFYDNTETHQLSVKQIVIEGEVNNPGPVDLSALPLRSVIVKETLLDQNGGDRFTGAYRYDGYSLFDILEKSLLAKTNTAEFSPIIDLYVIVENGEGESVVFSWGEIFYPNNLHKILIAHSVARIVPSKTKELWPLPEKSRVVAAADLITERNISDPVKITVRSIKKTYIVNREISPLISQSIAFYDTEVKLGEIDEKPTGLTPVTYNTIFYGRGRGIHSTSPFTGYLLKDVLNPYYKISQDNLRSGLFCIAGADGYRCSLSFSELFNRNDQSEFLMISSPEGEDGGRFRLFAAPDFFSDRAIKAISEITLLKSTN